jgi:hypothetical protein
LEQASALGAQTVPLGAPLANTQAFVVDARGNEQPVGIPGELWLAGAGVTQGYLNRPVLTAERFTTFRGAKVYRTGDRVRRLADGTLEFLGRADDLDSLLLVEPVRRAEDLVARDQRVERATQRVDVEWPDDAPRSRHVVRRARRRRVVHEPEQLLRERRRQHHGLVARGREGRGLSRGSLVRHGIS